MQASEAYDLVQPSRLFEIARSRFGASAMTLRMDGTDETVPTALHALVAIQQAEGGIHALKSTLVPGTTFAVRSRAVAASEHARDAIMMLHAYHQAVQPLGNAPLLRADVPSAALELLGMAQFRLAAAAAVASRRP